MILALNAQSAAGNRRRKKHDAVTAAVVLLILGIALMRVGAALHDLAALLSACARQEAGQRSQHGDDADG